MPKAPCPSLFAVLGSKSGRDFLGVGSPLANGVSSPGFAMGDNVSLAGALESSTSVDKGGGLRGENIAGGFLGESGENTEESPVVGESPVATVSGVFGDLASLLLPTGDVCVRCIKNL